MSLNFSSICCSPQIPRNKKEAVDRERLVFASMAIGLSTITTENLHEWLVRLLAWEDLFGDSWLGKPDATVAALNRWVGLETNIDDEPRERWLRRLTVAAVERAEAKAEDALGITAA